MNIRELETPAVLVRSRAMLANLKEYQAACDRHGKALWPMVKTHKSVEIALLQQQLGAKGFLCGTLDECEALCDAGMKTLMYAYPVAGEVSCRRAAALAKRCEFYVRLDGTEAAEALNRAAEAADTEIAYTLIVDCGLHRFGRPAEEIVALAEALKALPRLRLAGVSTHSGHVYREPDPAKVPLYVEDEVRAIHAAVDALRAAGYEVPLVTSGSTPTFRGAVGDEYINVCHPGNYIFNDCIQIANGTAREEDCALAVYATVISHPRADLFLCDAGAKCLGLDMGAHGNASVKGYGRVLGHPELTVAGLSEEVGKLRLHGETTLKVGDRITIIPNHSCSSANLTDWYLLVDDAGNVEREIAVDIRGNSTRKGYAASVERQSR